MATYLKGTSKLFDLSLPRTFADVNLRDLMCPVCRGILIEPVTLPCTHNLCLRCLKGTFEHNSLSCPLCRLRVGSWLRTATKSETLVNNGLWELIRTKFPKEVEDKHNGDDGDIELNAGYTTANKILSAPGEIRREYEAQLQMAEEEMRRQKEAQQYASEAFIRKMHAEEQQKLAQLAQDQLLAKTLAKKQAAESQKEVPKYYECASVPMQSCTLKGRKFMTKSMAIGDTGPSRIDAHSLEAGSANVLQKRDGSELRRSNMALLSKIRSERYASTTKANVASNVYKESSVKFCCQKPLPVYNAITRTLKHQTVTKFTQPSTSNYNAEPGCSTSKIYGSRSKEELHVPSDVLNSKKKSLGVEVCMTLADDDERIGSAESAGSHDSINQEIHHFKPIKAMPRTPLKMSIDGKQIDPRLIRVVPILKRASNVVPKPPSPTHPKRTIGCSWSAFRGKARQDLRVRERASHSEDTEDEEEVEQRSTKSQLHEHARRIDLGLEVSFDGGKSYARHINRIINGTKVSKRLILDEPADEGKVHKSWATQPRNGTIAKCKRQRGAWPGGKETDDSDAWDSASSRASAVIAAQRCAERRSDCEADTAAVENIAERIKRRKEAAEERKRAELERKPSKSNTVVGVGNTDNGNNSSNNNSNANSTANSTASTGSRKRMLAAKRYVESPASESSSDAPPRRAAKAKLAKKSAPKTKRRRTSRVARYGPADRGKRSRSSADAGSGPRKSARNARPARAAGKRLDRHAERDAEENRCGSCEAGEEGRADEDNDDNDDNREASESRVHADANGVSDEEEEEEEEEEEDAVVAEQRRMERLVLQEREDFELARRLQAKFDEMERIAGRTTRSRRAIELCEFAAARRTVCAATEARAAGRTAATSESKQRSRPRKRVK